MVKTMNDYNSISVKYQKTFVKPDKQFSTLPTALHLIGEVKNKIILDLGCGSGFFTTEFAKGGAKKVIGIDNSKKQLELAQKQLHDNINYKFSDIFTDELPRADIVFAPYVINYAKNVEQLSALIRKIFKSLNDNGKLILVVDLPEEGNNLKKYGAVKTIIGEKKDGAKIKIDLYNEEQFICTLNAIYFTPHTLENALINAGFTNIKWHKPIISQEGIDKLGSNFWSGYQDSPELGYISAKKIK
jgi:SAM-dependent methyltransferase